MSRLPGTRIDPLAAVPKYQQLYEILRHKIEGGEWEAHQSIPAERELEGMFNVSRTTVRQALDMLVRQGVLYREHGRGTFVSPPKFNQSLHTLTSFTDDLAIRGLRPGQKILELNHVQPSAWIRNQLELAAHVDHVLYLERLRLADAQPIGIHRTYLPLTLDNSFTIEELERIGSLYILLETKFNWLYAEADETLEATAADEREAELLQIEAGSPVLLIERLTLTQTRRPMEYVKMLYRADRYKYHVRMTR